MSINFTIKQIILVLRNRKISYQLPTFLTGSVVAEAQTQVENAILKTTAESFVGLGEVVESTSALDSLDDIDRGQVQQHFPHQLQGQHVQNHWFTEKDKIYQGARVFIANIEKKNEISFGPERENRES